MNDGGGMIYLRFHLALFALLPLIFFAQAPDTLWTKTYGGMGYEGCCSAQQTSDNGYLIFGGLWAVNEDIWLIKTDHLGDTLWTQIYNVDSSDYVRSGQQTSDGGYIIAGSTVLSGGPGYVHIFLMKTDSLGENLWTKIFEESTSCYSVQQTSDSGYMLAGSIVHGNEEIYLIKTNSLGDTLWTKTYGGGQDEFGWKIQETSDGGYVIAASTSSFGAGDYDIWLLKTDENGDTLWTKTYGGASWDYAMSVDETHDGGYIVAGFTNSFCVGLCDVWLLRTDINGDTLWTKTYGGIQHERARSVQQTIDNGFILAGYTASFGSGDLDIWVIKTDESGDTLWTKTYGGIEGDFGRSVQQTSDEGYIIAGETMSFGGGLLDIWLMKMDTDTFGVKEQEIIPKKKDCPGATILSGPLQLPKSKTCRVFDITGRVVMPDKIKAGIYFIEIDGQITQKVIKVR